MKLHRYRKFYEKYILEIDPIKRVLGNKKFKHSKRVANRVVKLDDREDLYQAAFYHDFLERGGQIESIQNELSPYSLELIMALSKEEGQDTLEVLKKSIQGQDDGFIRDVFLIKLVDRADNLAKKYQDGDLGKKYLQRSRDLITYIHHHYPGDKSKINDFIRTNILPYLA